MSVRVRFAPSPTGLLHVGALRTVLFDYLLAKNLGGELILRIEDTDRSRFNPDSEAEFVETLKWVDIEFNEGPHVGGPHAPYRQSERQAAGIYAEQIEKLIESGNAYRAFDTEEEIAEMRETQQVNQRPIGYFGGDWRDADQAKIEAALEAGTPYVVRLKVPRNRAIVVQDAIRGRIEFDSNTLPDAILIKGDSMPTYHFAAMVDDHLMGITHILRGEEWIPTSPYHWLLFEMFGWEPPVFVHCPVIVGADGKKLSKRHGATRVLDYMAQGYLKSALKNFIALIGWSPGGDEELFSESELISKFGLDGLQPSPGRFDIAKLKWQNGYRIRSMTPDELLTEIESFFSQPHTQQYWNNFVDEDVMPNQKPRDGKKILAQLGLLIDTAKTDRPYVLRALKEEQERVFTLAEFGDACEFFLVEEPDMDSKAIEKWFSQPHVAELMDFLIDKCDSGFMADSPPEIYEAAIREFQTRKGFEKMGPVVHPTRVAMTGKTAGPGLFELMSVLGPERIKIRALRAKTLLA